MLRIVASIKHVLLIVLSCINMPVL